MVIYDYLEGKLDTLGQGKLSLTRSQYSEFQYDEDEPPRIEPRQTNYQLRHDYIKHGVEHTLSLKVNFNFSEDTLFIYHTTSENTQNHQLRTIPLNDTLNDFTPDKVKQLYRGVTSFIASLLDNFQTNPTGVAFQPSVYVHRLFHTDVTFTVSSELINGQMSFKQYTQQETLLMNRVINHASHIDLYLQGNNRFYKDALQFDPPYDAQDIWYKLEEIRR